MKEYMNNQETDGSAMQIKAEAGLQAEHMELRNSLAECKAKLTMKTNQFMAAERAASSSGSAARVPINENGDGTATGLRQRSEVLEKYRTQVENNSTRLQEQVHESNTRQREIGDLEDEVISKYTNGEDLAFSDGV